MPDTGSKICVMEVDDHPVVRDGFAALPRFVSRLTALLLLAGALLQAQGQPISQMVHMLWSAQDGAPQGIQAITQTPDGLLWVSSLAGVYTFDGVSFTPFHAAEDSRSFFTQNFHFLLAARNGDLWFFALHGAPGRLRSGQFRVFDRVDWPYIEEFKFPQQGADGRLWAVLNERQLVWLTEDGIWHPAPCPGKGSGHITELFIDSVDTAWMVVDDRLFRRNLHSQEFEPTSTYVYGDARIQEGAEHDLWISATGTSKSLQPPARHLQHLDHDGQALSAPQINEGVAYALPETDGSLWIVTVDDYLLHLTKDQLNVDLRKRIREFPDEIRLTLGAEMAASHALFRALDGSIWVGGPGGLEHFTRSTLVPAIPGAPPGTWHSCVDSAGTVWINDPHGALHKLEERAHLQLITKDVSGLFCSHDGSITLRYRNGFAQLRDGRVDPLPPIPGLEKYLNHYMITGGTRTSDGRVLAAVSGRVIGYSLWAFSNGSWQPYLTNEKMPEVTAMYGDRRGRILLGFRGSNVIGVVEGNRLRKLAVREPGIRSTMGFAETSYGLFVYGSNGIAIDCGDYFRMLSFADPQNATRVMGLVESKDGDIWMASSAGVVRIAGPEIRRALNDPRYQPLSNDIREGTIVGPSHPELFSSKAHIDRSGRLWFTTLNGIFSLDPAAVRPPPPPLLSIRNVSADSHSIDAKRTFPPNIRLLAVDYIGVDFRNPRQVTYKYKLDSYDTAWHDAGPRTEAIYTSLGPGKYKFEVMAKNAYGVWSHPVTSTFTILPRYYQELWFKVFCALVVIALVWLAIRARLLHVEMAIRERAEERADERISIARDLHDTLLQGVQGLLLTFHSAAERVPEGHESKQALEHALATADKIIVEGRDRVKGLREQNLTGKELCSALEALGDDLNVSKTVNYSVTCEEGQKTLASHIASEVFLIAREAIINAFRHGQATKITVFVRYGRRDFTLQCCDDGRGFDLETSHAHVGHGHWGIRGMSERAQKLRALLRMRSRPGQGTSVYLALKASRAYE